MATQISPTARAFPFPIALNFLFLMPFFPLDKKEQRPSGEEIRKPHFSFTSHSFSHLPLSHFSPLPLTLFLVRLVSVRFTLEFDLTFGVSRLLLTPYPPLGRFLLALPPKLPGRRRNRGTKRHACTHSHTQR